MDRKEYTRRINELRRYVKPYGYSIRFRVGFWPNTDFSIELFKGYVHNTNRVWTACIWYNRWEDFDRECDNLVNYFNNYCK